MDMGLHLAEAIAHAAISHAEGLGIRVAVAVCGSDGRIVVVLKMDGSDVLAGHEAMRRAMTAAGAGLPSQLAGDARNAVTSASMEGIGLSHQAGGLPLHPAQRCFGAIGVCGGTEEQAVDCATAGAAMIPCRVGAEV